MRIQFRWMSTSVTSLFLLIASVASAGLSQDAWITTTVQMALLIAEGVDGTAIDVDTFDRAASLHGIVETEAEKTRAEQAAARVDGVRGVRNLLVVVPETHRAEVAARDAELTRAVETVLNLDPELESSDIGVESVTAGLVVLGGSAMSLSAHRHAVEVARGVEGVDRVASEIHSPDGFGDAEIWEETAPLMTISDSGFRTTVSDTWLETKTKVKLLSRFGLSPMSIRVDSQDGVVTLFGIVETTALKKAVESAVMNVEGVRRVVNGLQVVPNVDTTHIEVSDARIRRDDEAMLESGAKCDGRSIEIEVDHRVLRLGGTVRSLRSRLEGQSLPRNVDAVTCTVHDSTVESRG